MAAKRTAEGPTSESQLRSLIDRLDPVQQKLCRAVRAALRKRFPTANELAYDYTKWVVISYAPTDRGIDGVAAIRASDGGVALYLSNVPKARDPKKLLKGTGKQARYVPLESARQLSSPDLQALIAAAEAAAKIPMPATGKGALILKSIDKTKPPGRTSRT